MNILYFIILLWLNVVHSLRIISLKAGGLKGFYMLGVCKYLHLFSFKTPILLGKKIRKKCKINSRNFTYDGLTFSSSFWLLEEVKDEI